jgi:hypothetical protein
MTVTGWVLTNLILEGQVRVKNFYTEFYKKKIRKNERLIFDIMFQTDRRKDVIGLQRRVSISASNA